MWLLSHTVTYKVFFNYLNQSFYIKVSIIEWKYFSCVLCGTWHVSLLIFRLNVNEKDRGGET